MGNENNIGYGGDSPEDIQAQQAIRSEANYWLSLVEANAISRASGRYFHLHPETKELDALCQRVEERANCSLALNHLELAKVRTHPQAGRVAAKLWTLR